MQRQAFYVCEPTIAVARVIKSLPFCNNSSMSASFLIHNRYARIVPTVGFKQFDS